jgi:hypothetical protein
MEHFWVFGWDATRANVVHCLNEFISRKNLYRVEHYLGLGWDATRAAIVHYLTRFIFWTKDNSI